MCSKIEVISIQVYHITPPPPIPRIILFMILRIWEVTFLIFFLYFYLACQDFLDEFASPSLHFKKKMLLVCKLQLYGPSCIDILF